MIIPQILDTFWKRKKEEEGSKDPPKIILLTHKTPINSFPLTFHENHPRRKRKHFQPLLFFTPQRDPPRGDRTTPFRRCETSSSHLQRGKKWRMSNPPSLLPIPSIVGRAGYIVAGRLQPRYRLWGGKKPWDKGRFVDGKFIIDLDLHSEGED